MTVQLLQKDGPKRTHNIWESYEPKASWFNWQTANNIVT